MSGGIIISQRAAIKAAVNEASIYGVLSQECRDRIEDISVKGLADWSDDETSFMAGMLLVAIHS